MITFHLGVYDPASELLPHMSCLALEGRIFPATTPDRRFVVAYA
jgi:hypothetical protein